MKTILKLFVIAFIAVSCGGGGDTADASSEAPGKVKMPATFEEAEANWKDYQGVGPIKPFALPGTIDQDMAAKGQEVFESLCTTCHKADKKYIGPAPKGIFDRRNPAWVMNMILNPEEMVQKDPLAKLLLMEYNGSPMANQNLSEEDARAVLEYFRTL